MFDDYLARKILASAGVDKDMADEMIKKMRDQPVGDSESRWKNIQANMDEISFECRRIAKGVTPEGTD